MRPLRGRGRLAQPEVRVDEVVELEPDLLVAAPRTDQLDVSKARRETGAALYVQPGASIEDVLLATHELGFLVGEPSRRGRSLPASARRSRSSRSASPASRCRRPSSTRASSSARRRAPARRPRRRAGGENIADESAGGEPFPVNRLRRLDPDVYLATSNSRVTLASLRRDPRTAKLTAVEKARFRVLPSDLVQRAGPTSPGPGARREGPTPGCVSARALLPRRGHRRRDGNARRARRPGPRLRRSWPSAASSASWRTAAFQAEELRTTTFRALEEGRREPRRPRPAVHSRLPRAPAPTSTRRSSRPRFSAPSSSAHWRSGARARAPRQPGSSSPASRTGTSPWRGTSSEPGLAAFTEIVSSAAAGSAKPDPEVFVVALERLGVPPARPPHRRRRRRRAGRSRRGLAFEPVPLATLPERLGLGRRP